MVLEEFAQTRLIKYPEEYNIADENEELQRTHTEAASYKLPKRWLKEMRLLKIDDIEKKDLQAIEILDMMFSDTMREFQRTKTSFS